MVGGSDGRSASCETAVEALVYYKVSYYRKPGRGATYRILAHLTVGKFIQRTINVLPRLDLSV